MDSQVLNIPPIGGQWPVSSLREGSQSSTYTHSKAKNQKRSSRIKNSLE